MELTIKGRTFKVEGPTPFGTFLLTGPKGATFITAERWVGDHDTLKVIGWNGAYLAIKGNTVYLSRSELMAAMAVTVLPPARCLKHPAYEPDYCPLCGTAQVIGGSK